MSDTRSTPGSSTLIPQSRSYQAQDHLLHLMAGMEPGQRLEPERQLAIRLGVSRPTIRRALRSLEQQGLVQCMQGSGTFVRRRPAVMGVTTYRIGVVMATVCNMKIARIVEGIESQASSLGHEVILRHDHDDAELQIQLLDYFTQTPVHGVVVYPDAANVVSPAFCRALQRLVDAGRKVVLVDRYLRNVPCPAILTDHAQGVYELTRHLIEQGRRRIAMLTFGREGGSSNEDRNRGFSLAMREAGLSPDPVRVAEVGTCKYEPYCAQVVREWVQSAGGKPDFDAIVCHQDTMAAAAYESLLSLGIRVPEDVALVGGDDSLGDRYRHLGLELTSVRQPERELGLQAGKLILDSIAGKIPDELFLVMLRPTAVYRRSSGASAG